MGGIKRKISMEKIEKKDSRAVAFSKRRIGLYNKTSEFCLLSGAKVAILATPVSFKSNVSFYSFGHSSVDSVVSAFLANQRPIDDNIARKGLGFWWEDESLTKSENPKELSDAIDSISSMLQNLKGLYSEAVENRGNHDALTKNNVDHHQELDQNQTLNVQSTCAANTIQHDLPENFEEIDKNSEEEDQIIAISVNNNNNNGLFGSLDGRNEELDLDQIFDFETKSEGLSMNMEMNDVWTNQNLSFDSEVVEDRAVVIHRDLYEDNLHLSDLDEDQIVAISENNNNNNNALPGAVVMLRDLDEDNLHFL